MTYYFIASKGILGVKTNIKNFTWSFGTEMPQATKEEYDQCAVRINVVLENFNDDEQLKGMGRYHYFNGNPGEDKIYYTRKLALNQKMRVKAENLMSDEAKITVNKAYYKFITHRIMNLHSIHYIVTDLAALLLLKKGYAPIHCSAFEKDGKTIAIFAPPDTGKTLSATTACMEYGAQFIAEDMAITDGHKIYAVPWTNSFCHYSKNNDKKGGEASSKNVKKKGLMIAEVTHIAILEKGADEVLQLSESVAVSKLMNLNRYEFNFLRAPLLTAYEFFNPGLMIDDATRVELEILSGLSRKSEKVFSLKKANPTHYAKTLVQEMEEEQNVLHISIV